MTLVECGSRVERLASGTLGQTFGRIFGSVGIMGHTPRVNIEGDER